MRKKFVILSAIVALIAVCAVMLAACNPGSSFERIERKLQAAGIGRFDRLSEIENSGYVITYRAEEKWEMVQYEITVYDGDDYAEITVYSKTKYASFYKEGAKRLSDEAELQLDELKEALEAGAIGQDEYNEYEEEINAELGGYAVAGMGIVVIFGSTNLVNKLK